MQPMSELEADSLRMYYRTFARTEAAGTSPIYAEWAERLAEDDEVIALLLDLPRPKRQANLLFAAARHLGAGDGSYSRLRAWLLEHWKATSALMLARSTQTNEVGRCAVILPALAEIDGPLSLLEVGASAGLCLYPDRCSYIFHTDSGDVRLDPATGPSLVELDCVLKNQAPPSRLPEIAWRAGIDLNPIDVTDPDQRQWLSSLIWPEHDARRKRLSAAAALVAADPPRLVPGDLLDTVESLLSESRPDTTTVVFHSAVLAYLGGDERERFAALMLEREDIVWISNEGAGVVPGIREQLEGIGVEAGGRFVLAVDGVPKALTGPHGQSYEALP